MTSVGPDSVERGLLHRLRWIGLLLLLLVLIWFGGLMWFTRTMPMTLAEPTTKTDAIVVLTGGSERLKVGLDLLSARKAQKLFISGVYHGVEVAELMKILRGSPADFDCCVTLGYTADDTRGNARETAAWMAKEGLRSLRLVTSAYHMKRSLFELRRALPGVEIVPHPVFAPTVKRDNWWLWPGTTTLYIGEYNKYLAARLRAVFDAALGRGAAV
jgi:uncharacterized SAM-binding protein YcdF (DUF218 family)